MRNTILVALLLCGACAQPNNSETTQADAGSAGSETSSSDKPDYSDAGKQVAWIERGKEAIKAKLRDPDSAQFRDVKFHSGGGVPLACGEVNANNGFGGKAGYERFVAAGDSLAVLESEMTSSTEMDQVWNKMCVG
jgi:hypothetical protein